MLDSESVVGSKPGDTGVVIGYQVDELTCTWLVECFIAQWHICPLFMGKVLTLTHFLLVPGKEDYSSLDQAVEDVDRGLDFILMDPIETSELNASLMRLMSGLLQSH